MNDDTKDTKDVQPHRNDIYGDIERVPEAENPAIPAATVVLLRDGDNGAEVLMVHRTSKVHFGGMWVFPGGRIDPGDYQDSDDIYDAARNAAARETMEETGLVVAPEEFVHFAHWLPPATTPRRYSTWFFATALDDDSDINVDGHEIQDHDWVYPGAVLERHAKGEVDLAPPTWITLYHLSRHGEVEAVLKALDTQPSRSYETRIGLRADGVRVAMWSGDAGYESTDANAEGDRHRLILAEDGFAFENTVERY